MKRYKIEMVITPEGVTANGEDIGLPTMLPADLRHSGGRYTPDELVYRRDIVRKVLQDWLGIELPRGARMGHRWTVVIEADLWRISNEFPGVWTEGAEFDDQDDLYFVFFDNDASTDPLPVTAQDVVQE